MSLEKVEDIKNTIEVFNSDIELAITMFCEENHIDDISSISQSIYSAMLMYIYNKCFKDTYKLQYREGVTIKYDIDLIYNLCLKYIYMCKVYDKEITLRGFSYMTGINLDTFYEWNEGGLVNASPRHAEIFKMLNAEREASLSDKLLTGKNPVGILGILNHFYGWNGVGNMTEDRSKQAATLADVRESAGLLSDNSQGMSAGTTEKLPDKLSNNLTQ